jgi:predicted transcriptional regulator
MRDHLRQHQRIGDERRDDVIPPEATEVMIALLAVYHRDGRATVSTVAWQSSKSRGVVHVHLDHLEAAGLIARGGAGQLRPLVSPASFMARRALTR